MDTLSAWSRALRDPSLRDLPYKIETNEYGQLVMSPQKPKRGHAPSRIGTLLHRLVPEPARGAVEVWTCDTNGDMRFYGSSGKLSISRLVPNFPMHVEL